MTQHFVLLLGALGIRTSCNSYSSTALQCLGYCCTTTFDFLLYYSVRKGKEIWVSDVLLRHSGVWIILSNLT